MGVLEILQLRLKPAYSPSDPIIIATLDKERKELREKVHNTQSRMFTAVDDPSLIYIFGVWPSLEKHRAFLASPLKAEIINSPLFKLGWMFHIPLDSIDELPLDAPVVAVARQHIKGNKHVTGYKEKITETYRETLLKEIKPYKIVSGWRVDGNAGEEEHAVITGWETKEDHMAFEAGLKAKYRDYARLEEHGDQLEVYHLKDLEG